MFDPSSAFEEKMIECEPRPKMNWKEWFLNLLQNVSVTVIGFSLLVFLSTLPLIFNFGDAKWYAKILMLLGSLYALLFLLILPAIFTEATKSNKWLLFFSPLSAIYIVGIISYFNFELWGHKSFAIGLVFIWTIFIGLYVSVKALFNKTLGSENTPIVLVAIAILTLFIAVVNEKTSNNASADLCYKISVGIVYLIAIALYANRYIYKQRKEYKVISNIIGIVFWGAIITISFPFYIQWCGLTGNDFDTFVSVYAAVLGGGITLAGVAWTINDTNDKRQDDLKRAEQEKREDERLRYRPFLNFFDGPYQGIKTDIWVLKWLKNTEDISKEQTEKLLVANFIRSCYFGNTDFSNFYVWGVKINNNIARFDSIRYIKKSSYFFLDFSQKPIYTEKSIDSISLILEDMLENLYELKLEFLRDPKTGYLIIGGNNPTVWIGKAPHDNDCDYNENSDPTSHNQSTDKKKWLI